MGGDVSFQNLLSLNLEGILCLNRFRCIVNTCMVKYSKQNDVKHKTSSTVVK